MNGVWHLLTHQLFTTAMVVHTGLVSRVFLNFMEAFIIVMKGGYPCNTADRNDVSHSRRTMNSGSTRCKTMLIVLPLCKSG
jgi:hypothetical protein